MYIPKTNEEVFDVTPIGVRYKCESCNQGEMRVFRTSNYEDTYIFSDELQRVMIKHQCDKCEFQLLLQKEYPYIEWIPTQS